MAVMTAVSFRGVRVALGEGLRGAYVDDLRDPGSRAALREALADGSAPASESGLPLLLPELIVGDHVTTGYKDLKEEQRHLASELWRTRGRIRALEAQQAAEVAAAASATAADNEVAFPAAVTSAPTSNTRFWSLVAPLEPLVLLPPECEQEAHLRDLGAGAAVAALDQALRHSTTGASAASSEPLLWPPRRRCTAEHERLWSEVEQPPLRSESYQRRAGRDAAVASSIASASPLQLSRDTCVWSCWLAAWHHPPSGRVVASVAALRKPLPPLRGGVQRLCFVALGGGGIGERGEAAVSAIAQRLLDAAAEALEAWRSSPPPPPQPRRDLVARCEELCFPIEYARRVLPLRPSVQPLLTTAADAVVEIAQCGALSDGAVIRARVSAARSRLTEALARASALQPARQAAMWRHRLSLRLASELALRSELVDGSDMLLPWPAPSASRTAALRAAALHIISGFGEATRRWPKQKEAAAAEAGSREATKRTGASRLPRLRAAALEVISFFGGADEGRRPRAAELVALEAFEEARRRGAAREAAILRAAEAAAEADAAEARAAEMAEAEAAKARVAEARARVGPKEAAQAAEEAADEERPPTRIAKAATTGQEEARNNGGVKNGEGGPGPGHAVALSGLVALIRLYAHPRCGGGARRALGDVLDYLLHITPTERLHQDREPDGWGDWGCGQELSTGHPNAERGAACLEPIAGVGAGLGAYADVIASLHKTSNRPARLGSIPLTTAEEQSLATAAVALSKRAAYRADDAGYVAPYGGGDDNLIDVPHAHAYACNLDVLCLMLREGYVEKRVGAEVYPRLLLAFLDGQLGEDDESRRRRRRTKGRLDEKDDDEQPDFLLRVLAEAATKVISRAHVRAGARQGHDVRLTAAQKRLQPLLGPAAMEALRADLVAHIDWCGGAEMLAMHDQPVVLQSSGDD